VSERFAHLSVCAFTLMRLYLPYKLAPVRGSRPFARCVNCSSVTPFDKQNSSRKRVPHADESLLFGVVAAARVLVFFAK
jgi:hypothetical protein